MIRFSNSLAGFSPRLLAVLIGCLAPADLRANAATFRNDTTVPLVVQTATLEKGVLRRDQAQLVRSNESTAPIKTNVDKLLFVYDGKTNRVLYRDVLRANKKEAHYGIAVMPHPTIRGRIIMVIRKVPAPKGMAPRGMAPKGMPGR
jgi:hypothetical protein